MFDSSTYTIGWVCALPCELIAARVHLDEEHNASDYESPPNDNNAYSFGIIGKHNVVIATLPRGEYGISSAASVARDLVRSFPNVSVGLLVGIGGGAPLMEQDEKQKQDIRLGDVVVSTPSNGRGGVCQFDYGKAIQGQEFLLTGHHNPPSKPLLAAVNLLESDFRINGHDIEKDLTATRAAGPRSLKFGQRPDTATDRLYHSSFIHPDHAQKCSAMCDNEDHIVQRPARGENEEKVVIYYGLIASANTLMKDAILRNTLTRTHGVLCFEMEAAGLMDQLPFLVVRGICDYSDSHKSKDWQDYAAMTAAAYTRKLLLRLTPNKVETEERLRDLSDIRENLRHVRERFDQIATSMTQHIKIDQQRKIESWLAAPNPSTNYDNALALRHEGSGSWVLRSSAFKEWRNARFPLLWLHGISGCGKTVLASTIIRSLCATESTQEVTLYLFFDVQDIRKQTLNDQLRSLIWQLYCVRAACRSHLEHLYSSCQDGISQPTTLQLVHCFAEMCQDVAITIVLDALDESSDCGSLLTWIQETSRKDHTRLIVTSRTEYEIGLSLTECIPLCAILQIEGDLLDDDIKAFIHFQILHTELQRWKPDPEAQSEIEKSLMWGSCGMFRWVVCQVDAIKPCLDRPSLERTLNKLPQGLDETYARILQRLPTVYLPSAVRLLQFLVFSNRPLKLEEAVDVLAVTLDRAPYFDIRNRMPKPDEIAKICGSLTRLTSRLVEAGDREVEVVTEVQLAHPSVRDYLSSGRLDEELRDFFKEGRAKATIVQISLAYLYESSSRSQGGAQDTTRPFDNFAARYWFEHASVAEREEGPVRSWILELFESEQFREYWLEHHDPDPRPYRRPYPSALYYASLGGMVEVVRALLTKGAVFITEEGYHGNALQAASTRGHLKIVKLLTDHGANVDTFGGRNGNALQAASYQGHLEIVKMLLDMGANVNAAGGIFGSALQAATAQGRERIVKLLLDSGADVSAQGGYYGSALRIASREGHVEIVKSLLERDALVNTQRRSAYRSALQTAAAYNHVEIVKLLTESGAHGDEVEQRRTLSDIFWD